LKGNYLDGWFLDEESKEIDIDDLLGHADYTWPNDREYADKQTINGIIYRHPATHQIMIRDPCLRQILPAEIHRPTPAPSSLETLKIFLDIYYDDFGAYRSVYHAVGGVYVVIGNLPLELRQKLRNIFLIGLIPPTVAFGEFFKPLADELHNLQNGVKMHINSKDYWVVAGITLILFLFCFDEV
jgi:hypothetical protein